jgi:hypothetical protein
MFAAAGYRAVCGKLEMPILPPDVQVPVVERLPIEMLSEIFVNLPPFFYPKHAPELLSLMLVCKRWRTSILCTPQLWTNFAISLPSTSEKKLRESTLKSWLTNAGQLPLDVEITLKREGNEILSHVMARASQFKKFKLSLCPSSTQGLYMDWGDGSNHAREFIKLWDETLLTLRESSLLRDLTIQIPNADNYLDNFDISLPSVHRLSFSGSFVKARMFKCPELRTLVISSGFTAKREWLHQLSEDYKDLEELTIHTKRLPPSSDSPVNFPKLVSLSSNYDVGRVLAGSKSVKDVSFSFDRIGFLGKGFQGVVTSCHTLRLVSLGTAEIEFPWRRVPRREIVDILSSFVALDTLSLQLAGEPNEKYAIPVLKAISTADPSGKVLFPTLTTLSVLLRRAQQKWPLNSLDMATAVRDLLASRLSISQGSSDSIVCIPPLINKLSFEEALKIMENVVHQLEQGEIISDT